MKRVISAIIVSTLVLGGCANQQQMGSKQTIGAITGAVLGGFLGSHVGGGKGQVWATGAGIILGALAGSNIGQQLDAADTVMMERTSQAALEHTRTGTTSVWNNPDTGNSGSVKPVRTYQRTDGTYCREYTQTVMIAGEPHEALGTACRQPNGTWKIVP